MYTDSVIQGSRVYSLATIAIVYVITPYIRMLDSDWLIAVIFYNKFRPCFVNLQNLYFM
jgi:hypothetical protein